MNLIIFNNFILETIDNQIQMDVIFSNFSKAFILFKPELGIQYYIEVIFKILGFIIHTTK